MLRPLEVKTFTFPLKKSPWSLYPMFLRMSGNALSDCSTLQIGNRRVTAKDNRLFVEAVLYRYHAYSPSAICQTLTDFSIHITCAGRRASGSGSLMSHCRGDNEYVQSKSQLSGPSQCRRKKVIAIVLFISPAEVDNQIDATQMARRPTGFHLVRLAHDLQGADVLQPGSDRDPTRQILPTVKAKLLVRLKTSAEERFLRSPIKSNRIWPGQVLPATPDWELLCQIEAVPELPRAR